MSSISTGRKNLIPFYLFYITLTILVSRNSFFWDTIQLGSEQAHWFYEHNFRYLFLPQDIDSGHPPLFGMYLAALWKIAGRSLFVSHIAMLPFLLGIVFQADRLISRFFNEDFRFWTLLLFLADPTLLAQSILISPDILLLFFFLWALNALLDNKKIPATAAMIPLALISMRGMMHVAILFVIFILHERIRNSRWSISAFIHATLTFAPAAICASAWLMLHFYKTGWIGYHENSPWKECFQPADFKGTLKNILILGWRLADFGRIFIWIAALPLLYLSFRNRIWNRSSLLLALLLCTSMLVLVPNMILRTNLLAHRYLIILYLSFLLLALHQLQLLYPARFKKAAVLLLIALLTGNLWVYPEKISQGWDSSLAHYPYYGLRKKMIAFIKKEHISPATTGSAFPNVLSVKYTDLSSEDWKFQQKDLRKNRYIFYSNIFNGFSDEEIDALKHWKEVRRYEWLTVEVVLYKNPDIR